MNAMLLRVVLQEVVEHVEVVEALEVQEVVDVNSTDIPLLDECMSRHLNFLMNRDTQKATEQGWGHEATSWESAQPIAEADREQEKKEANEPTSAPEEAADGTVKEVEPEKEEEPEPMTYKEWLEQNKKKAEEAAANVRQPDQTQWEAAKELVSKKAREAKEALLGSESAQKTKTATAASSKKTSGPKKVLVDIEQIFSPVRSERGGRGRGGARGTGERGGRGRGRGEGGRGRGGAAGRGGRGGSSQTINVADTEAFPALG